MNLLGAWEQTSNNNWIQELKLAKSRPLISLFGFEETQGDLIDFTGHEWHVCRHSTCSLALGISGLFPGMAVMWPVSSKCASVRFHDVGSWCFCCTCDCCRLVTASALSSTLMYSTVCGGASLKWLQWGSSDCCWLKTTLNVALLSCSLWPKFLISGQPGTKFVWNVGFPVPSETADEYPHSRWVDPLGRILLFFFF